MSPDLATILPSTPTIASAPSSLSLALKVSILFADKLEFDIVKLFQEN